MPNYTSLNTGYGAGANPLPGRQTPYSTYGYYGYDSPPPSNYPGMGSVVIGGMPQSPNSPYFPAPPINDYNPDLPPAPTPPAPSGGGGGGSPSINPLGFAFPEYSGPRTLNYKYEALPEFTPPEFRAPTAEEALNSPGFQFRLDEGRKALERSAAARGVLRSGGTLKDILGWGQNFASQEYGNVFDRALQGYDRQYQGARDVYAPKLLGWQTRTAGMQDATKFAAQQAWNEYAFKLSHDLAIQQMLLNQANG